MERELTLDITLGTIRDNIAGAVIDHDVPHLPPLPVDRWIASSALQKAVRLGQTHLALQAALAYFSRDRAGFLRRLPVIAVEDVGIGDVSSVTAVIAATLDARWRARVGGDWVVASYLIGRMCKAPKERSADYLLLAALAHPDFDEACRRVSRLETTELLAVVGDEDAPLPTRAIAAWYL